MSSNHPYDLLLENDMTSKRQDVQESTTKPINKFCVLWDTGRKMSFRYHDLMTVDLSYFEDINIMTLQFIKNDLILKGYNLTLLFSLFWQDKPQTITVHNPRYITTVPSDEYIVIEASIAV